MMNSQLIRTHPALSRLDGLPAGGGRRRELPVPSRIIRRPWPKGTPKVAVAILCRDQGRFLAEAIESVLDQTFSAREVVVIDDASTDDTAAVAARFAARGVRYRRINAKHPRGAKRAALDATTSEAIMFLDADDVLPPAYLSDGAPLLIEHTTGIVYSDIQEFGESDELVEAHDFDPQLLLHLNYIHSGALVLRQALLISQALDPPDGIVEDDDWRVWQRIVSSGFRAVKQPVAYRRRRYAGRPGDGAAVASYFERSGLADAEVTVFILLSCERAWASNVRPWLESQTWPRERVRLRLVDVSGGRKVFPAVNRWLSDPDVDFPDYLYTRDSIAGPEPGPRLLLRMARELTTNVVFTFADGQHPPAGAIEQLLRAVTERTTVVSGNHQAIAYSADDQIEDAPAGGETFGTLIRRSVLSHVISSDVFAARSREPYPYDIGFCHRAALRGEHWMVARDVLSEHYGAPALPPLPKRAPAQSEPVAVQSGGCRACP